MRHSLKLFAFAIGLTITATSCRKDGNPAIVEPDFLAETKAYVASSLLQNQQSVQASDAEFNSTNRSLLWDQSYTTISTGQGQSIWIPIHYPKVNFITFSLDKHRLFNTNFLQQLHVWKDSKEQFHAEVVTRFPDSNYVYGQKDFSGIVLVRDWQDHYIRELKFDKDGSISARKDVPNISGDRANPGNNLDEICFYSSGYNYAEATRSEEIFYWEIDLGCYSFFGGGGGGSTSDFSYAGYAYSIPSVIDGGGGGGSSGGNSNDLPYVANMTVLRGGNIIGNIRDYTKCFDNIPGSSQNYTVTLCVSQPVPGTREAWGVYKTSPVNGGTELIAVGHTFLILTQSDMVGRVTRNVGFYPQTGVSPITPVDQGELNNDQAHDYDVSLTITMTNSQFFTILDFISHGNDPGYNYDLNSNNCSTFAIRALRSAGINIPATIGTWPDGKGYNPGDLGQDIMGMELEPGMSRSTEYQNHPNWGICY